jgi:hypothetical protein
VLGAGCGDAASLGPPDSYTLLAPDGAGGTVHTLAEADAPAVVKLFYEGFGAEMLRTVYMAKQLVREGRPGGEAYPDADGPAVVEGLPVVVGLDRDPFGRGLSFSRWLRGPVGRPEAVWVGLPAQPERDRALIQTVSGRLATYVLELVMSGGTFADTSGVVPPVLGTGYRQAMEVIAREWRVGKGPAGVVPSDAGTPGQRALFAGVRENLRVLDDRGGLRPAAELLADPQVAATVIYRMAQSRALTGRLAPPTFYAPYASRVPPGISPAAVLGTFRHFQAKLLGAWSLSARSGHPPRDIADLVETYAAAYPDERKEALRVFLVTTYGATVQPGGVSPRPQDGERTVAALQALLEQVVAGSRPLRAR